NFELPDLDLSTLMPESDRVEQRVDNHVMARLLDVPTLLRLMPQPYDKGSYVLGIEDAFLPEVAGRWQVAYEGGHATSVECTDAQPDLIADETSACQLILGRAGLQDALYRPDVQVLGNADVLAHAFTRRPVYLSLT
ncbi:MAG: sterol carrier protein domain-containing protein, partial [Coriobacteriales bacterium]|nr:sterol carrier protein domain-containing protein [Coriobacteriales bacterium]